MNNQEIEDAWQGFCRLYWMLQKLNVSVQHRMDYWYKHKALMKKLDTL